MPSVTNYIVTFLIESLIENCDKSIRYCVDTSALVELISTIKRENYKTTSSFEEKIKNSIIQLIEKKAEIVILKLDIIQIITEID